jgi:iron complex outermembrane receptor protein
MKRTIGCVTALRLLTGALAAGIPVWASAASDSAGEAAQGNVKASADAAEPANGQSLPMTRNVVSRGVLDAQSPQDTYEALKNVAGVTNSNSKGTIADNINIRGIPLSFSTSYRLNGGLPIVNISTIPTEDKERIEALKGANALMFGIASPAGIVNLVTKRAGPVDVTSVGFNGNSFGAYGSNVDVGRRFGAEKEVGIRVNASAAHLETGVDGAAGHSAFGSVAADWKVSDRLNVQLDVEQYSRAVVEQAQLFQLKPVNGVISVPRIPDPTRLLSGPWANYRPESRNVMLHGDFRVSSDLKLVAETGRATSDRSRVISRLSNYNLTTGQATESITLVDTSYKNTYSKAELLAKASTGLLRHEATFGVMSNERDATVPTTTSISVAQNIYDPLPITAPTLIPPSAYGSQISKDVGIYAYDTIKLGDRWQFLAGLRRTNYKADNTLATGVRTTTESTTSSPAAGIIFNITPSTNVYASYMKGLEETGIAPVGTRNQFAILPPASATQSELGLRSSPLAGLSVSTAYFKIKRANTVIDTATNVFLIDGTTEYQGLEATVSADLSSSWSINSGAQLMHAVQNSVIDKSINGLAPESTPRLSGNLSVTHRPSLLPGVTLTAGTVYTGRRAINPQNQAFIPGVSLLSLGAGYTTSIYRHKTALQFNIDNLTNKTYWSSAGSGAYAVGTPRVFKFNMKIDL